MTSARKWSSWMCRPSRISWHSTDTPGPDDLRQPVEVHRHDAELLVERRAHRVRPRLAAEQPELEGQVVRTGPRVAQRLGDRERIGRRRDEDLAAQVDQQQRLTGREPRRDRDDGRAEALGALVKAQPAGEQAVAVGVVDEHPGTHAGDLHAARHHVGPHVEVGRRVGDDRRLAARPARGVDPRHLLARNGEQAERVVVAQVGLGRERQAPQIVQRCDVGRRRSRPRRAGARRPAVRGAAAGRRSRAGA